MTPRVVRITIAVLQIAVSSTIVILMTRGVIFITVQALLMMIVLHANPIFSSKVAVEHLAVSHSIGKLLGTT